MKKIFLYLVIMAAVVACDSAEFESDSFSMITETISGTYGPATKATIADADASFKWSVGDNIAVHVSNGNNHKYVFTSGEGGASVAEAEASFSVTYESGYSRDAFAVFPSSIVSATAANYGQSGSPLDVTLPDSYTLSQVQGEVSPCPMIATNTAGNGWTFYQLCSLLRITVGNIPATAKRLELDFDGKKVWGDFSIASDVTPGTSVISPAADDNNDVITITNDGSVFGQTSLTLSIPLPVGDYSKITVYAYDEISGGNVVSFDNISFSYTAVNTKGVKKTTSLTDQSIFTFTFRDADTQTNLDGLRFVRIFSCQNKLYNGSTTFGPYTISSATGEADMANHVEASLKFGANDGDQLAFQVIDANGKVYSGLYNNVPAGGFTMGSYDLTVDVKAYTFTVASGKKVYFSPGDLGLNNNVLSFTEPFITWGWSNLNATQRVWFDYQEGNYPNFGTEQSVYGLNWRFPKSFNTAYNQSFPHEWRNIIQRTINEGVATYYHVKVGSSNCLLLPPDETDKDDLEGLTNGATNINYVKYLGKGFVLLMNTGRCLNTSWGMATRGFYWGWHGRMDHARRYFTWTDNVSSVPDLEAYSQTYKMRVRYIRDVK